MASHLFKRSRLTQLGLEPIELDNLVDLQAEDLRKLDVWVDQYNHQVDPKNGIASSHLLTILLLEQISKELVEHGWDQPESKQNLLKTLQPISTEIDSKDPLDQLVVVAISKLIKEAEELHRLYDLTVTHDLTRADGWQEVIQQLRELPIDDNLLGTFLNRGQPNQLDILLEVVMQQLPSKKYEKSVLRAMDLVKEQTKFRGGGPGEVELPSYDPFYPEAYTTDRDWMPQVVLLAKHTKVWLHQLSRKYGEEISTLDAVPTKELKLIRERGFTGLWLIGIWERSEASQTIKQRMGNLDAAASAYSIWDYIIAKDLGGHEAYYDLSERARSVNLRLASDMVPNHTGIVSKWVIQHPDWFIQTKEPPFHSYQFQSEDLADHPHISVHLEDKYYSHQDAAVVFKRVDHRNGDVRYIYHGNDGTSIPWNDTAQLNFLRKEVRENVINTILHVARMFPIIRLDAAMVLTKQHFQRLWYPIPGTGGDIPSRSRHTISQEEFERMFPVEFWREVVDRIAEERPETLLVAEAFWMLEGYFVRTLGVHRVYNSAFMHMLRDQKNKEYRELIKSTLVYDPRILQRYVNFMSNPDEDTAIEQFDRGDKYFGITVLMSTLPGMPMFGHGQVEGFREKYGMEFQRDYLREEEDPELVNLHERLVFPLLQHRSLFAGVTNFRLYDIYHPDGYVIEDIFAFTNRTMDEFFLICYNNTIDHKGGWLKNALPFNAKALEIGSQEQQNSDFYSELKLESETAYVVFKNYYGDQYFMRKVDQIRDQGLQIELSGYQFQVYRKQLEIGPSEILDEMYKDLDGQFFDENALNEIIQDL